MSEIEAIAAMMAVLFAGTVVATFLLVAIASNEIRRAIIKRSEQEEASDDNYFAGR